MPLPFFNVIEIELMPLQHSPSTEQKKSKKPHILIAVQNYFDSCNKFNDAPNTSKAHKELLREVGKYYYKNYEEIWTFLIKNCPNIIDELNKNYQLENPEKLISWLLNYMKTPTYSKSLEKLTISASIKAVVCMTLSIISFVYMVFGIPIIGPICHFSGQAFLLSFTLSITSGMLFFLGTMYYMALHGWLNYHHSKSKKYDPLPPSVNGFFCDEAIQKTIDGLASQNSSNDVKTP